MMINILPDFALGPIEDRGTLPYSLSLDEIIGATVLEVQHPLAGFRHCHSRKYQVYAVFLVVFQGGFLLEICTTLIATIGIVHLDPGESISLYALPERYFGLEFDEVGDCATELSCLWEFYPGIVEHSGSIGGN